MRHDFSQDGPGGPVRSPGVGATPAGSTSRRRFLRTCALGAAGGALIRTRSRALEPIARTGSAIRLSCAAYSFRTYLDLKRGSMKLEEFIDFCAQCGLEGTELTSYYFPRTDTRYLHSLKARAFTQGLSVSGTAVGNNFALPPGPAREKQLKHVRNWIDHAAEFGAPVIRIFGGATPKGQTDAQAQAWVVENIEACADKCEERGVFLAIENHGGFSSRIAKLLDVTKQVKMPWFGINLDSGNFHEDDPYDAIRQAAPYAVNVQLKVSLRVAGKREPADFARIFGILREANYRGWVALEYEEKEDPKSAVPRYIEQLQQARQA